MQSCKVHPKRGTHFPALSSPGRGCQPCAGGGRVGTPGRVAAGPRLAETHHGAGRSAETRDGACQGARDNQAAVLGVPQPQPVIHFTATVDPGHLSSLRLQRLSRATERADRA